MSIETLKKQLPDYAKDIKLNLSSLASDETLSEQQLWGCFLACAISSRQPEVIKQISAAAHNHLTAESLHAAKAAASIMAMNNVYYKFVGMIDEAEYKTMPAKLRMNVIGNPGVDKADFELWSLAVSALNGCQYCVNAHEPLIIKAGLSKSHVQTAVRIASVVQAVATTLSAEEAFEEENAIAAAA